MGGTSGIGENSAREFIRHTIKPRVYLVGRSAEQAAALKTEFQQLNPESSVQFIQNDVSLLRNVDKACDEIKSKEDKINLLVLSAGIMTAKGRDETIEGLDKKLSLHYYSRLRFAQNLLPLLNAALNPETKAPASVISVLGAGLENTINLSDLSLKSNYSLSTCATHAITMNTLSFQHLASQNSKISFIHTQPGGVSGTNLLRGYPGFITTMMNFAAITVFRPWVTSVKECGERHIWAGMAAGFTGGQAILIGPKGAKTGNMKVLEKLRQDGIEEKVWDHTMEVFEKVCDKNEKY